MGGPSYDVKCRVRMTCIISKEVVPNMEVRILVQILRITGGGLPKIGYDAAC